MNEPTETANVLRTLAQLNNPRDYQELHWEGSFEDYLKLVRENPRATRNAFQRIYDMILSHGTEEYTEYKKKIIRYKFFRDEQHGGRDAVYGIDQSLNHLVDTFKAAAHNYGPEKRVILLHGPVGSAKSTIVRLLKRGLEQYSRSKEGALYTFQWKTGRPGPDGDGWESCPMHEEPLRLVPAGSRAPILEAMNAGLDAPYRIAVEGDLCPSCRMNYRLALERHGGDWGRMIEQDIRVRRLVLSEKDRVGIGTFQPKDEKNQDSTELTGDINYRKI